MDDAKSWDHSKKELINGLFVQVKKNLFTTNILKIHTVIQKCQFDMLSRIATCDLKIWFSEMNLIR